MVRMVSMVSIVSSLVSMVSMVSMGECSESGECGGAEGCAVVGPSGWIGFRMDLGSWTGFADGKLMGADPWRHETATVGLRAGA